MQNGKISCCGYKILRILAPKALQSLLLPLSLNSVSRIAKSKTAVCSDEVHRSQVFRAGFPGPKLSSSVLTVLNDAVSLRSARSTDVQ